MYTYILGLSKKKKSKQSLYKVVGTHTGFKNRLSHWIQNKFSHGIFKRFLPEVQKSLSYGIQESSQTGFTKGSHMGFKIKFLLES